MISLRRIQITSGGTKRSSSVKAFPFTADVNLLDSTYDGRQGSGGPDRLLGVFGAAASGQRPDVTARRWVQLDKSKVPQIAAGFTYARDSRGPILCPGPATNVADGTRTTC